MLYVIVSVTSASVAVITSISVSVTVLSTTVISLVSGTNTGELSFMSIIFNGTLAVIF